MGYPTDLTLKQRSFIFENFPEIFKTKSKTDIYEILNAVFYLIKSGCQWTLLPNDYPKWRTVYEFYRKWTSIGFFDRLTRELNAVARNSQGKQPQPTVAVIDSQSVRAGLPHSAYPSIRLLKADNGYRGALVKNLKEGLNVELECVKSNFGTSEFNPINGRWVVERTFSWLESFRQLTETTNSFYIPPGGLQ